MKNLFTLICAIIFTQVQAQISLNQEDYFRFGNVYYRGYLGIGLDSIDLSQSSGEAQVWDFSWLQSDITDSLRVTKADLTPYFNEFPSAEFAISTTANNFFYEELNPDGVRILGRVVYDGVQDFNTIYQFNTQGNSFIFPMEYGSSYDFSYGYRVQYPAVFPGSDSIRNYNQSFFELEADAWGTLNLPMGQFDVLRLKQTAYINDTTQIYDAPGGWFSPTFSRDTIETWLFYTEDVGYRLLSFSQRKGGTNKGINWIKGFVLSNGDEINNKQLKCYPQPASDQLNIDINEYFQYSIRDVQGRIVSENDYFTNNKMIDVSKLNSGMYFMNIRTISGLDYPTRKIIVLH